MRRLTATMLTLLAVAPGAFAQDDGRPTSSLKASTPQGQLVGEWELSMASGNLSQFGAGTAPGIKPTKVAQGSSFQLKVKLIDPNGKEKDVTGSSKLIYRPKGCMSVAANGVATVLKTAPAPWTCNAGDAIPLTIIYADESTGVGAVNMYLFSIQ